jgi:hypothetical protein
LLLSEISLPAEQAATYKSGTARLERWSRRSPPFALEEWTREHVPLGWATAWAINLKLN